MRQHVIITVAKNDLMLFMIDKTTQSVKLLSEIS